jgi:hypothetical protein
MVQISSAIRGASNGDITRGGRDVVVKIVRPDPRQARHAVRTLRRSLAGLELPAQVRSEAGGALEEIERELQVPDPDRGVITAQLERFAELTGAGAVASPSASLIRPIRAIATWIGPIGAALFRQTDRIPSPGHAGHRMIPWRRRPGAARGGTRGSRPRGRGRREHAS